MKCVEHELMNYPCMWPHKLNKLSMYAWNDLKCQLTVVWNMSLEVDNAQWDLWEKVKGFSIASL